MVLFSIVLSFFCVLIFYCFNKRISVSPKPGMVYAAKRWNSLLNHLRAIESLGPFKKGLRSLEDNDQKLLIS